MIKQFRTSKSEKSLPTITIDIDSCTDIACRLDKLCAQYSRYPRYHCQYMFHADEVKYNEAIVYLLRQGWVGIYEG